MNRKELLQQADKIHTLKQSDFDLAFQETMLHFQRAGLDKEVLDNLLPRVLGLFEGALQDKYPTEHMIEKMLTKQAMN